MPFEKLRVESADYNQLNHEIKMEIAALLKLVWPDADKTAEQAESHPQEFNVHSFYLHADAQMIAYAGVVRKRIQHFGQEFHIAGLSSVAVHPYHRGCGLGHKIVAAATAWIENEKDDPIDFGIFTCHPSLVGMYQSAGSWMARPDIVLIASKNEDALSSETMNVVVMMRYFSNKAETHQGILCNTRITLDFPKGEFL